MSLIKTTLVNYLLNLFQSLPNQTSQMHFHVSFLRLTSHYFIYTGDGGDKLIVEPSYVYEHSHFNTQESKLHSMIEDCDNKGKCSNKYMYIDLISHKTLKRKSVLAGYRYKPSKISVGSKRKKTPIKDIES